MKHRTLISNRANALRKELSEPEVMLWSRLRGRRGEHRTFRRQHPFGSIILDFYCPSARLAIEVDGSSHWEEEQRARDDARDAWLRGQGIEVLRIPASRVYADLAKVVHEITATAEERRRWLPEGPLAPSTTPSSGRGPPPAASRGR